MHQGRGGDQAITERPGIGNMQSGTPLGHGAIHRQNAPREGRQHRLLEPLAQQGTLARIPPFHQQHPQFQFVECDR